MNLFFRKPHFKKNELDVIREAIEQAETKTSGEIRVFVENRCKAATALDRAADCFLHLKMEKTTHRNGVLIYVAMKDKKFAIIGDAGIHQKVGEDFWEQEKNILQQHFVAGKMIAGICACIDTMGKHLQKFFPSDGEQKNELNNDVIIG